MDPLAIFAAPALGAAYNLLVDIGKNAVIRWYSGHKNDPVPAPGSTTLRGDLKPLRMNPRAGACITAIADDLERLDAKGYGQSPELVRPADQQLMETLARLRGNLEQLFEQRFTFADERTRPESGCRVNVRQEVDVVGAKSKISGAKGKLKDSNITVAQQIGKTGASSEVIGFEGEVS